VNQLLLVVGSWKVTVIKHLGVTKSVWQRWQQDRCVPRGVRATMGGAWLHCHIYIYIFFLPIPEATGATGGAHSQASEAILPSGL